MRHHALDAVGAERVHRTLSTDATLVTVVERVAALGLRDSYVAGGAVFQTLWNAVCGRPPETGIKDYDVLSFDPDRSWSAEDTVIRQAAEAFADLPARVEVRNEARVHLWYEDTFGVACEAFTSTTDAIDDFAATTCSVGVRRGDDGAWEVYAPYGWQDVFAMVLRPNPVLAPREVYEAKAVRWQLEWPRLKVLPWPEVP